MLQSPIRKLKGQPREGQRGKQLGETDCLELYEQYGDISFPELLNVYPETKTVRSLTSIMREAIIVNILEGKDPADLNVYRPI